MWVSTCSTKEEDVHVVLTTLNRFIVSNSALSFEHCFWMSFSYLQMEHYPNGLTCVNHVNLTLRVSVSFVFTNVNVIYCDWCLWKTILILEIFSSQTFWCCRLLGCVCFMGSFLFELLLVRRWHIVVPLLIRISARSTLIYLFVQHIVTYCPTNETTITGSESYIFSVKKKKSEENYNRDVWKLLKTY